MSRVLDRGYERLVGGWLMPFYETRLRKRDTFRYWQEFEANQWRSPEEIATLQWERLRALLRHAYDTVPYYRSVFDNLGIRPEEIRGASEFERLPILEKATIRAHKDELISSAYDRRQLIPSGTGGSTGEPLRVYYDRSSYDRRVAAAMRGDGWAGWRLCGGEFYIWGAPLLPEKGLIRRKKQLHHAGLRREVVNSFELSPDHIEEMVRRYNRQQPRVVVGYANPIYEFARYARQAGLSLHRPVGVISSAEKLFDYQRAMIEEAFGAPVFDRYGCREVMMIAAECERHDGLHVTADNLYVEIVRGDRPCAPGESGELLLTDLHNYGMPFIRYKVGDVASWKEGICACGRGLPLLNVVEGRTLDMISTPDGRVVPGEYFIHLLKDYTAICRFQVVQERRERVKIRLALAEPLPGDQRKVIEKSLVRALGSEMQVDWEVGPDVQIEQGQKLRPVLSSVPVDFATARK
jgi:phenylacetate-CoA ligase